MTANRRIFLNIVATCPDRAAGDIDRAQPVRRSLGALASADELSTFFFHGVRPHGPTILKKNLIAELVRFGVVGGISFVIDFGVLVALQELGLMNIHNGVLISAASGFTISLIAHYFMATYWVFKGNDVKTGKDHARAASLFVVTNVVGLLLNEFFMWLGVTLLAIHYIPVKLFATAVVMVWNYLCQKLFIFRQKRDKGLN